MLVLGVESSCDETGIALVDTEQGLLAHALHSQVAMHAAYGGVCPTFQKDDFCMTSPDMNERHECKRHAIYRGCAFSEAACRTAVNARLWAALFGCAFGLF